MTMTLDDLIRDNKIERVDIIKIDVEHVEDKVLRGGIRTIETYAPRIIICETSNDSDIYKYLTEKQYCPYRIKCGDIVGLDTNEPYWGNILFLREGLGHET